MSSGLDKETQQHFKLGAIYLIFIPIFITQTAAVADNNYYSYNSHPHKCRQCNSVIVTHNCCVKRWYKVETWGPVTSSLSQVHYSYPSLSILGRRLGAVATNKYSTKKACMCIKGETNFEMKTAKQCIQICYYKGSSLLGVEDKYVCRALESILVRCNSSCFICCKVDLCFCKLCFNSAFSFRRSSNCFLWPSCNSEQFMGKVRINYQLP